MYKRATYIRVTDTLLRHIIPSKTYLLMMCTSVNDPYRYADGGGR